MVYVLSTKGKTKQGAILASKLYLDQGLLPVVEQPRPHSHNSISFTTTCLKSQSVGVALA